MHLVDVVHAKHAMRLFRLRFSIRLVEVRFPPRRPTPAAATATDAVAVAADAAAAAADATALLEAP